MGAITIQRCGIRDDRQEDVLKIILSRKGFDSSNGRVPSPILPDGRLVPLPIPSTRDPHTCDEVKINDIPLGPLVEDLTACKIARTRPCHLDPDLDAASLPRLAGWLPAFGQIDAAQTHLARHDIGAGDLFLSSGTDLPRRQKMCAPKARNRKLA